MAHQYRISWNCRLSAGSGGLFQITGLTRLQSNTSPPVRNHRQYIPRNVGESIHHQGLAVNFPFSSTFHSCVPRKGSREV